jgi:hypothetical protein
VKSLDCTREILSNILILNDLENFVQVRLTMNPSNFTGDHDAETWIPEFPANLAIPERPDLTGVRSSGFAPKANLSTS